MVRADVIDAKKSILSQLQKKSNTSGAYKFSSLEGRSLQTLEAILEHRPSLLSLGYTDIQIQSMFIHTGAVSKVLALVNKTQILIPIVGTDLITRTLNRYNENVIEILCQYAAQMAQAVKAGTSAKDLLSPFLGKTAIDTAIKCFVEQMKAIQLPAYPIPDAMPHFVLDDISDVAIDVTSDITADVATDAAPDDSDAMDIEETTKPHVDNDIDIDNDNDTNNDTDIDFTPPPDDIRYPSKAERNIIGLTFVYDNLGSPFQIARFKEDSSSSATTQGFMSMYPAPTKAEKRAFVKSVFDANKL